MATSSTVPPVRTETITVPVRRQRPLDLTYLFQQAAPYIVIAVISVLAYSFLRVPTNDVMQTTPVLNDLRPMPVQEEAELHVHETMHTSPEQRSAFDALLNTQEKLEELKEIGSEKVNRMKGKLEELKDAGSEKVEDLKVRIVDLKETGERKIKQKGEEILSETLENVKQAGSEKVDLLKEKLGEWKETGAEKLGELKNDLKVKIEEGKETAGMLKEKINELKEGGAEKLVQKLEEGKEKLLETSEKVKETTSDLLSKGKKKMKEVKTGVQDTLETVAEGMKEVICDEKELGIKQKAESTLHELKEKAGETLKFEASKWLPLSARIGMFIQRVSEGFIQDRELRHYFGMRHQWEKLTLQEKADILIKEMHVMGDDVVEEMITRMEHEKVHHQNEY